MWQPKRPFDQFIDQEIGTSSSPRVEAPPISRSDSLQSLRGRTDALVISPEPPTIQPKRAKTEQKKVSEVIDLTFESDTDDEVIIVEAPVKKKNKGKQKAVEMEKERENLGPWWKEGEMKSRRERFLLTNASLYESLLPGNTGYFAKLQASTSRGDTRAPLPTTPAVPYVRLSQPSLISKNAVMKDYQLSGLSFLAFCAENGINPILADEMGLGKTLQTLSLVAYLAEIHGAKGPHLIVCPLSVLSSWMSEIARWLPGFKAMRFHGTLSARSRLKDEYHESPSDIIVTTYEAFVAEHFFFKHAKNWGLCVLDEGHRIKNSESQAALAVQGIRARMRIILSGTPLQNNLVELWSLLHFLDPLVFHEKTMQPFKASFDLSAGNYDQQFLKKAQQFLELVMIRRTKEGVSSQLTVPPRVEHTIYVPLSPVQKFWTKALLARSEPALLEEIFNDFETQSSKSKKGGGAVDQDEEAEDAQVRANVQQAIESSKQKSSESGGTSWTKLMNLLMQLRKVCNHPYILPGAESEPFEVAEHIVQASSKLVVLDKLLESIVPKGERVLIFSQFTMMLDILEDFMQLRGHKYCRLDGSTPRPRRTLDIRLFQQSKSPYQIYLISTRAGGLGINLTAASTVVMFDQDWNPQVDLQAIARAHRIGQEKNVQVYKFVCQDSVEEQMLTRLRKKLYLSAKVMGSMRNLNEQAGEGGDGDGDEVTRKEDEAPKMSRGELAGILRGGASALGRWSNNDGTDPFDSFKASTIDEIIEKGQDRDENKEAGIKFELGENLSEEQKKKLEKEEEEAEALLLAGREAVQSRKFEGKMYGVSNNDIRQEWQEMEGKQARLDKSRTTIVDGFAVSRESLNNKQWEAVKTITSDPKALKKLQDTKGTKKQFEHEDWCCYCRDGGEVFLCRSCPRVAHAECAGYKKAEMRKLMQYVCPQHSCHECGRTNAEAGGLLFRCQICPIAYCEDCLPPGDLDSVGDVLPEFLLLDYGKTAQAHFIKCNLCLEHFSENPSEAQTWQVEQDKIEKKARKMGYDF